MVNALNMNNSLVDSGSDNMKYLLILLVLVSFQCYADTGDNLMHETAHFGGAYAITDITNMVCNKATKSQHKVACVITGIAAANIANIAYKATESFPDDTKRSLISGALGSATAGFVIKLNW